MSILNKYYITCIALLLCHDITTYQYIVATLLPMTAISPTYISTCQLQSCWYGERQRNNALTSKQARAACCWKVWHPKVSVAKVKQVMALNKSLDLHAFLRSVLILTIIFTVHIDKGLISKEGHYFQIYMVELPSLIILHKAIVLWK